FHFKLTNFIKLAGQFFQVCRELFVRTPSIPRHQLGKRGKQPRVIRRPRFVELANDVFTGKPLNLSDVNNRRFATAIADLLCQPLQALVVLWLVGKQIGRRFQRKRPTLFQLPPEVDSRSAFLCGQSVKQKNPFVRRNHGGEAMKCNRYFNLKHLDKILISHLMKSLFGFLGLFSLLTTLAQAETLDTSKIEQIIGLKGALNTNEGVFKVTSPRNDVKISVEDWTMPPFMGLASWAAFTEAKMGGAMVMGDTVLFQDEVNPAMSVALDNGLAVTALHNHF